MTFVDSDGVTHCLLVTDASWLDPGKVMVSLTCRPGWMVLLVNTLHFDRGVDCMSCLVKDR